MHPKIATLVKRVFNQLGYEIIRLPKDTNSSSYALVTPQATYSPWNKDNAFQATYKTIQPYTLVDKYRCYELWCLIEQSSKLGSGNIIEIGVWRGGTGVLIAQRAKSIGIPDKVYLCDTFTGVVKTGAMDPVYKGGEHGDTSRKLVEGLISRVKLDNVEILEGIFPEQTSQEIEHLRFRFCHIDVDVYQSAKDIVGWIWQKMVRGGIIVYDDYGFVGCDGIAKYIEEQTPLKDRLIINNLNGHAVIIKL